MAGEIIEDESVPMDYIYSSNGVSRMHPKGLRHSYIKSRASQLVESVRYHYWGLKESFEQVGSADEQQRIALLADGSVQFFSGLSLIYGQAVVNQLKEPVDDSVILNDPTLREVVEQSAQLALTTREGGWKKRAIGDLHRDWVPSEYKYKAGYEKIYDLEFLKTFILKPWLLQPPYKQTEEYRTLRDLTGAEFLYDLPLKDKKRARFDKMLDQFDRFAPKDRPGVMVIGNVACGLADAGVVAAALKQRYPGRQVELTLGRYSPFKCLDHTPDDFHFFPRQLRQIDEAAGKSWIVLTVDTTIGSGGTIEAALGSRLFSDRTFCLVTDQTAQNEEREWPSGRTTMVSPVQRGRLRTRTLYYDGVRGLYSKITVKELASSLLV